jgi:hypothetical protein
MPPPSPLTRRPQATALSIEELLDRVRRGEIRVPEVQRPLQWDAQHIRDLLDSVYRGYPIGTLIFWRREAPAASVRFGPVAIDAPHSSQALLALDGQQRITALVGVLLHPPYAEATSDDFALYFDLQEGAFVHPVAGTPPATHWLPLNIVLDSKRLFEWLERHPGPDDKSRYLQAAIELSQIIRQYQVLAYIVEADAEQVVDMLTRLAFAGSPLLQEGVLETIHGEVRGAQPATLHELSRGLGELGFGTIEYAWLFMSALAIKGSDITQKLEQIPEEEQDFAGLLPEIARALQEVIIFIKRDAGIPHIELLPYKLPLALLARFFHRHSQPSPRSRELLARWLWRGAITKLHNRANLEGVRASLAAMSLDEERSVQALLAQIPSASPMEERHLGGYDFETARTKLQLNALLALQPRDLRSGELIDGPALIEQLGAGAIRKIYEAPPRDLKRHGTASFMMPLRMRSLANRLLHPVVDGKSLQEALLAASSRPELLQSHGVSPEAFSALSNQEANAFLDRRARFLSHYVRQFLDAKARWGESDRGSLQSLIVPDEED